MKDVTTNPQKTSFSMVKNRAFLLRLGTRQRCALLALLFNIVSEVLTIVIK